mgnify:CR=1 FL=1
MKNEKFEIIAKTLQGLEDILAQEIAELGGEDIEIGKRMVSFKGDKQLLYKTNLCCRTALRVLKPIFSFTASDTDEVYEKAVERIADEIEIATRKEDIKLVEDSKKWILSPERKASKREKQYALDRLDGVVKKIEYAITKTISKMKNRLLKPENKNIMVQEIKKEVKPSILKKLSEKKASITRNGETGKLNKESSLDNER